MDTKPGRATSLRATAARSRRKSALTIARKSMLHGESGVHARKRGRKAGRATSLRATAARSRRRSALTIAPNCTMHGERGVHARKRGRKAEREQLRPVTMASTAKALRAATIATNFMTNVRHFCRSHYAHVLFVFRFLKIQFLPVDIL